MELYFLRHGDAEIPLFKTPRADFERNLTEIGIKDTLEEAFGLKEFTPGFDVIFTSPLMRAMQTAAIFGEIFDCNEKIKQLNALAPPGDLVDLLESIALEGDVERVLCVGHAPSLGTMATEILTGIDEENFYPLRKGGLLCMELEHPALDSEAHLIYLLEPIFLKRIGIISAPDGDQTGEYPDDSEYYDELDDNFDDEYH